MNDEFNPFEYFGVDPNGKTTNEIRGMRFRKPDTFNPFLQNDTNETTIDNSDGFIQNDLSNLKNNEITNMLGVDINQPMTDEEKHSYVDSLSNEDWEIFQKLRDEGYSFEQRKTLLDNRDSLYNINNEGIDKYYKLNDSNYLVFLRNMGQDLIDKMESTSNWSEQFDEYYYNWMDEQPLKDKAGAKVLNVLENVPSLILDLFGIVGNVGANITRDVGNKIIGVENKLGAGVKPLEEGEDYQTYLSSMVKTIKDGLEGAGVYFAFPIYLTLGYLGQTKTRAGEGLRGADEILDYFTSLVEKDDKLMSLAKEPGNEELVGDIEETIKYGLYWLILGGVKKGTHSTRMKLKSKIDGRVNKILWGVEEGGKRAKQTYEQTTDIMKEIGEVDKETQRVYDPETQKWEERVVEKGLTKGGKETVKEETWKAFKEGFKTGYNKDKAITPYKGGTSGTSSAPEAFAISGTEKVPGESTTPTTETKGGWINDIVNKVEKFSSGLDNSLLKKIQENPTLQEGYERLIKPFLESKNKDINGVIEKPIKVLGAYVKNKIVEYRDLAGKTLQGGDTKANIKFANKIERILDGDYKEIFEAFSKMPKSQRVIIEKIAPGFSKQLDFINDIFSITEGLSKNKNWMSKYLNYKKENAGKKYSISGYLKRLAYRALANMWDSSNKHIKRTSLESFMNKLDKKDLGKLLDILQKDISKENYTAEDRAFLDMLKKQFDKEEVLKMEENGKSEGGYMPETMKKYNSPKNIKEVLNEKMPGQNKTLGQYFEDKGVQLSIARESSTLKRIVGERTLGVYDALVDRIYTTEEQTWKGVLLHEFFHRVLWQLNTSDILNHLKYIEKRTGLKEGGAIERFAEYGRNFLETGDIDGKPIENTLIKELGRKDGTALYSAMKQAKDEMSKLFGMDEGEKNLYQLFNDIKYDTKKGQEVTSKKPVKLKERTGEDPGYKTKEDIEIQEKGTYGEGKFDYESGKNQNDLDKLVLQQKLQNIKDFGFLKEPEAKYDSYLKEIRKEIPDVVGLTMRDGKLYVKFLIESAWERREQADRPGQREIHEIEAKNFFMPDELEKLPKDLQTLIKGGELEMLKEPSSKKEVYLGERTDDYDSGILGKWAKEQTEKEIKSLSENIGKKEVIDWFEKYFDYELQRTDKKGDMFRDILGYLKGEKETKDFTKTESFINDFPNSVIKEINEKLGLNAISIRNFHNKIKQLDERIHNPEKFKKNIKGKEYTVYYL